MGIGRRPFLLTLVPLAACTRRTPRIFSMPEVMPGGWRLQDSRREGAKTFGTYVGPGSLTVEVEDVGSFAAGLDRAQRTQPEANMVFFNKGNYFVTVRWSQADREDLLLFVKELESRF